MCEWSPPAPENCSIVDRLWVPTSQRFVARKRNFASSGWFPTALMVPNRFGTSTPLRATGSVVVVMAGLLVRVDCSVPARMRDRPDRVLETTWRSSGEGTTNSGPGHHGRVIVEFGEFEIDTARFELRHRGEP